MTNSLIFLIPILILTISLTPWQLFQQMCGLVSPNSPQCFKTQQQQQQQQQFQFQQPFNYSQQQQPFQQQPLQQQQQPQQSLFPP